MNRSEASWALQAVLPHAGQHITIEGPHIFGTDKYTTGLARVLAPLVDAPAFLPVAEARDLERFIRPRLVRDRDERIQALAQDGQLHVACGDDSAVFDLLAEGWTLAGCLALLDSLYHLPDDRRELILRPDWAAKFAKAKREENDWLRVYPRMTKRPLDRGVAMVSVGADFVGAIAGLAHDDAPNAFASFLQIAEEAA